MSTYPLTFSLRSRRRRLLGGFLQPNSWYRAWTRRRSRTLYIMAPFEAIFVEMFRVNHESSQRTEIGSMRSHESYPFVAVTLVFRTSEHLKIQHLDQEYCCILRRHTATQPFPSGFRLNCKFVGFLLASGSIEISQSVYFESRIWRHFRLLDSKPLPKRLERASLMTDSKRSKNTLRKTTFLSSD